MHMGPEDARLHAQHTNQPPLTNYYKYLHMPRRHLAKEPRTIMTPLGHVNHLAIALEAVFVQTTMPIAGADC